ncbi:MAG TPA: Nif3-like dinuclear metal center hexameric protein [Actinomycetota bacterium]|nr:Nif3-like dinuclear metal center hexameric protein [Actinomycetota bacterium]
MAASPRVEDWTAVLDRRYPPSWAEAWDSVGLQAGDRTWPAERVLVALDPTAEVVDEAAQRGCGLVVTHHPLVFRPLKRVDLRDAVAATVARALAARVAVFACHTNADVAAPGVSDALAETLDVRVSGVLRPTAAGARVKLVTFCPPDATAKVLDAIARAGGGVIGEYTHCSFRVRGTGTFLPSERARPAVGERGALNEVEEDRVEVVVPADRSAHAVEALVDAHPYEEVAYDLYPLAGSGGAGLGRLGTVDPLPAGDLAERCRERLGSEVRLIGDASAEVRSVAVCGGSGGSLVGEAIAARADAYVTGDVKHHEALEASAGGLSVIDAGHHGTEWPFVPRLAEALSDEGPGGDVLVSGVDTDPFR